MRKVVIQNLNNRMTSYADLIQTIDSTTLTEKAGIEKEKTVAEHLWCITGARESYAKALEAGEWQGFSCSMNSYERADFARALAESAQRVQDTINATIEWTPVRDDLLAALYEHEVMHEGQLIRHLYGLGRTLPPSWRWA